MKKSTSDFERSIQLKSPRFPRSFWFVLIILLSGLIYALFVLKLNIIVQSTGSLKFSTERAIHTRISGFIKKVYTKDMSSVKANKDILFQIENKTLQTQIRLKQNERRINIMRLYKMGAYFTAKIDKSILRQRIAALNNEIRHIRSQLQYQRIYSEIDGTVIGRDLGKLKGKLVKRGDFLCKVVNLKTMTARTRVLGTQIHRIQKGQKVLIRIPAFEFYLFEGEVSRVYSQEVLIKSVPFYIVEISFKKTLNNKLLKAGMNVIAKIITGEKTIFTIFRDYLKKVKYKIEQLFT